MKNLTVKKIALGLFLAGYATSSAFALDAMTKSIIKGNEPVLKSNKDQSHAMTVKIMDKNPDDGGQQIGTRPAKVGDIIRIEFELEDSDGDVVSPANIQKTLSVFVKKTKDATTWDKITTLKDSDIKTEITTNENTKKTTGVISFAINDEFEGAEKIGYQILERTDFGAPYTNKWLLVTDIWSQALPAAEDPADGKDPTKAPTDPKDGDHGPGDSTNNGSGPVESTLTKIGIFKLNGAVPDLAKDYSRDGTLIPKYGDKFTAIVWNDKDKDGKISDTEVTKTSSYKFQWSLGGEYDYVDLHQAPAGTETLKPKKDEVITVNVESGSSQWDSGTNNVITLGATAQGAKYNSVYDTAYYPAGMQGFKLKVVTLDNVQNQNQNQNQD